MILALMLRRLAGGINMRKYVFAAALAVAISPASAEESLFGELVAYFNEGVALACAGQENCLRTAASFSWFLWNNRDKADVQYNTMKCAGFSAVKRGYIWSPMSALENASPTEAMDFAIEVCDCVIGYWGRDAMCRHALVNGEYKELAEIFDH